MQTTSFPWQRIIRNAKFLAFFVLAVYVGLTISLAIDADPYRQSVYQHILDQIKDITLAVFDFARPFIIVILLALLVDWLLKKFDLNIKIPSVKDWNMFNVLFGLVVTSFVFSALSGLGGTTYLKDLALVFIGFYFGTFQRKAA